MNSRRLWVLGVVLWALLLPSFAGAQEAQQPPECNEANCCTTDVRPFVQDRGPTRAWRICASGRNTNDTLAAWCGAPSSHWFPSSTCLGTQEAQLGRAEITRLETMPLVVDLQADGTTSGGATPSANTGTATVASSTPQMAIAEVLLRGLAQFLVTRASAELQSTVLRQLREQVCPDVAAACSTDDAALQTFKDSLTGSCDNKCDDANNATLRTCIEARRSAFCVGSGECRPPPPPPCQGTGCRPTPSCAELGTEANSCGGCLRQSPLANGTRCAGAALAASVATNTCRVIGGDFSLSPSFGSAFQAAVAQDIAALPSGLITFFEAPFGEVIEAGNAERLAQALVVHAVHEIVERSSPANAGHALSSFVQQWQCPATDATEPTCRELKVRLLCSLALFTAAAETMPSATEPQLPERLMLAVLNASATSGACVAQIGATPSDHLQLDAEGIAQIASLAHAVASATEDLRRMQQSQRSLREATSDAQPQDGDNSNGGRNNESRNGNRSDEARADDARRVNGANVQALTRDLIEAVNVALRIASPKANCPVFQIPDGFPAFVGAIAVNDVPSALSRGMRFAAAVFERVEPRHLSAGSATCTRPGNRPRVRIPDTLVRVLSFGADLLAARTPDDAEAALEAFSAPVGSWRGKSVRPMFSITGMLGVGGGGDITIARGQASTPDGVFFLTGMLGADLTHHVSNPNMVSYWGVFLSLVDVGALVALPVDTPSLNGAPTSATFNALQFVAPGLFFHFNILQSPLNFMFGAQFLPVARTLQFSDSAGQTQSLDVSAVRIMGALTVDVTILPF